jgi:glycosyltransferase involved in cell wall biosynthesis
MSGSDGHVPAVSVVMPVHNALPHLDQAIESIIGQTFGDFEFVILDDASTDESKARLRHWAGLDPRIRLFEVAENLGPVRSSNMVARAARAPLVARMDADDVSYPDRLSEEAKLLSDHPDVGVVASVSDMIDATGQKLRDAEVWRLARPSVFVPFAHGSIMYRREIFEEVGGYRTECEYWEDQDLVVRMAAISKVAVIARPLYCVRQSTTSTRVVSDQEALERAVDRAYQATDRLRAGQDYEQVLSNVERRPAKVDPRVFIALGSIRLWAGERPRLFRRTLSRGRLSFDLRTVSPVAWAAWATASPSSLRRFLLILLSARNRLLSGSASNVRAVRWRPGIGAEPIEANEIRP